MINITFVFFSSIFSLLTYLCRSGSGQDDAPGSDKSSEAGRRGGAPAAMGFSASLQGPSSHVALLGRQDAEVRLLDTMRRVLVARAKCDRDYSSTLMHLAHTAAKMDMPDNVLENSLLHKVRVWMLAS